MRDQSRGRGGPHQRREGAGGAPDRAGVAGRALGVPGRKGRALARELREELALDVRVCDLLARAPLGEGQELALYVSRSTGGRPQPNGDHDCVRWLSAGELSSVSWLDADLLRLDAVGEVLRRELLK